MSIEDFEHQKNNLFELINSWEPKNIRLATLIWDNNPLLKQVVQKEYQELLRVKDYKSLVGLRLLANLNSMDTDAMEEHIQYLMKAQWLNLKHTNLSLFPSTYLKGLVRLKIHSTTVSALPTNIYQLQSLEFLDLDGCRNLCHIPTTIRSLRYLKKVNFRGTAFGERNKINLLSGTQVISSFFQNVELY